MAEVETLLREFVSAFEENGEANPREYVDQLEGVDRAELEALIDAYLERAPARAWDATAFEGSDASQLAERLHTSLAGESGLWPSLLPRLRDRAQLKRGEVVERLAKELGHPDNSEKIGGYYHEMESGLLPSEGVSDRVLDALAAILSWTKEGLRKAGRPFGNGGRATEGAVFARALHVDAADMDLAAPAAAPEPGDEIDQLFRGQQDD